MAAHLAHSSPDGPAGGYTRETIARLLIGRREVLISQLPRRIKRARLVPPDLHALIVDDAIDFLVTENEGGVIRDRDDLEKAFWTVANLRVQRAYEGRYDVVRAGWTRVDVANVDVPDQTETPEDAAIHSFELGMVEEFKAILTDFEQKVLGVKYGGTTVLARFEIARRLGLEPFEVRRAERAIERKLRQFSAVVAAGRLCENRGDELDAMLMGRASGEELRMARAHLNHCAPCRSYYLRLMRAVASGRLQREIGQIVPTPAAVLVRHRRSPWEAFIDWVARLFGHDPATASQLGAVGRGASTVVGAKLLAACIGGAAVISGGLYCVGRLDPPAGTPPHKVARVAPPRRPRHRPAPTPTAVATPVVTHTPTPTPTPRKVARSPRRRTEGEVSSSSTSHEQATAISPPATTSSGARVDEFGPGPEDVRTTRPAAAPANGGPEFP